MVPVLPSLDKDILTVTGVVHVTQAGTATDTDLPLIQILSESLRFFPEI